VLCLSRVHGCGTRCSLWETSQRNGSALRGHSIESGLANGVSSGSTRPFERGRTKRAERSPGRMPAVNRRIGERTPRRVTARQFLGAVPDDGRQCTRSRGRRRLAIEADGGIAVGHAGPGAIGAAVFRRMGSGRGAMTPERPRPGDRNRPSSRTQRRGLQPSVRRHGAIRLAGFAESAGRRWAPYCTRQPPAPTRRPSLHASFRRGTIPISARPVIIEPGFRPIGAAADHHCRRGIGKKGKARKTFALTRS